MGLEVSLLGVYVMDVLELDFDGVGVELLFFLELFLLIMGMLLGSDFMGFLMFLVRIFIFFWVRL